MFFLAGGFAAAASWPSWRARGGRWAGWIHSRFARLLRPTTWFVMIMTGVTVLAALLGAPARVLAQAGWGVALQLWFLPVYLLLLLLAVPMIGAWDRIGWLLLAALIGAVGVVDLLVRVLDVTAAGWLSYLTAPAAGLVLGVAWNAGALSRRVVQVAMVIGGVLILLVLVAGFGYPPWMVGVPGEPPANTAPPNLALVAFAATQIGLVLLLERPGRRLLERPRAWMVVLRGNAVIMTMYLWHMVPVVIVAALMVALDLPAGPAPGGVAWWVSRLLWFAVLGTILAGLVTVMARFERPTPPRRHLAGPIASTLLLACAALCGFALSRLAVGGFAPSGHLAIGSLALYAVGVVALWLAGSGDRPQQHADPGR
jgi:hypothetical protein